MNAKQMRVMGIWLGRGALAIALGLMCAVCIAPRDATAKTATKKGPLPLIDAAGYQRLVARHKGKLLVVNFWATWCVPCRKEYPLLIEVAKEYQPKGVVFEGISFDEASTTGAIADFLTIYRPVFPNYQKDPKTPAGTLDAVIDRAWSGGLPSTIFYRRDGVMDAQFYGPQTRANFEKEIESLLKNANPFATKSGK
ncbi:MAG TPA: TlpA disulfide reductase family protein [Candidatus Acidoferrales bacterium]|nr:TlpA disulfide reductase family protein [Candidatus Acidoferrales bacterium]